MFVSHHREKLINATIFFVTNTNDCHTLKLNKLLNFLDFEHFRQTGQSVTGLNYNALPMGPVSFELLDELKSPKSDFAGAIAVAQVRDEFTDELQRRDIKPRAAFDPSWFTKRELKIMKTLAEVFAEAKGDTMSSFSHDKTLPWFQVFAKGEGKNRPIPYKLSLQSSPVIPDMPSLSTDEVDGRHEVFREIDRAIVG